MGLSYMVYPGAHHTRFHHVLGCTFLMKQAIDTLRSKDVVISEEEERGLLIAILLHDIGHGPFSHALEHSFVKGGGHEFLSLKFMELLDEEFKGELSVAIEIFKGTYHRPFMMQLISGQLDMDRLDYLKRDSFYSGVAEGNINVERLITMLNVVDEHLVLEYKAIYSIEKFIMARRFMYWQVYLHKTGIVAENILTRIVDRARELIAQGVSLDASQTLRYFLNREWNEDDFDEESVRLFARLDDFDLMAAIKEWQTNEDVVLSYLCRSIIERKLLRIEIQSDPFDREYVRKIRDNSQKALGISSADTDYIVYEGRVQNTAYNSSKEHIRIMDKQGLVKDLIEASDATHIQSLAMPVEKYFLCYPKNL